MPPLARIAQTLRVDENSARNFCTYIQRQFTQPPSFKMIAQAVEQLTEGSRGRDQVIEWLRCNWPDLKLVAGRNLLLPKPPGMRIGIPETGSVKSIPDTRTTTKPARRTIGFIDSDEPDTYSPILTRDPRTYYHRYQKCPHGIVSWGHCAICDPDGYKDYVYEE
jgi:hypothetical protein